MDMFSFIARRVVCMLVVLVLSACQTPETSSDITPLIVAHRGASAYMPQGSLAAYQRAIEQGADYLGMPLQVTKDDILVVHYQANLARSTDIQKHPEFAQRYRSEQVDGQEQRGWFVRDFTLEELKKLRLRPVSRDFQEGIASMDDVVTLVRKANRRGAQAVGIYPEIRHPTYYHAHGHDPESLLVARLKKLGWNTRTSHVIVESQEPSSLKRLRSIGGKIPLVQMIRADGIDYSSGELLFQSSGAKPYDWTVSGETRTYADMVQPAGLREIQSYANGIGAWRRFIVPVRSTEMDVRQDSQAQTVAPTSLITDAHKAGLFVHVWTFGNRSRDLPMNYWGNPRNELRHFYALGADGVFVEAPDVALSTRRLFRKQHGLDGGPLH